MSGIFAIFALFGWLLYWAIKGEKAAPGSVVAFIFYFGIILGPQYFIEQLIEEGSLSVPGIIVAYAAYIALMYVIFIRPSKSERMVKKHSKPIEKSVNEMLPQEDELADIMCKIIFIDNTYNEEQARDMAIRYWREKKIRQELVALGLTEKEIAKARYDKGEAGRIQCLIDECLPYLPRWKEKLERDRLANQECNHEDIQHDHKDDEQGAQ